MNVYKVNKDRAKEVEALSRLVKQYTILYSKSEDDVEKEFYRYSSNIIVIRINELLNADVKTGERYKTYFDKMYLHKVQREDMSLEDMQ